MKKYLGIIAIAAVLLPALAFAQSNSSVTFASLQIQISQLLQLVNQLQAQLNLLAQQNNGTAPGNTVTPPVTTLPGSSSSSSKDVAGVRIFSLSGPYTVKSISYKPSIKMIAEVKNNGSETITEPVKISFYRLMNSIVGTPDSWFGLSVVNGIWVWGPTAEGTIAINNPANNNIVTKEKIIANNGKLIAEATINDDIPAGATRTAAFTWEESGTLGVHNTYAVFGIIEPLSGETATYNNWLRSLSFVCSRECL